MSTTTTIRLPAELKARIASAAERTGKTTHSLILEAITEKAEQEELRAGMDVEADARFANIIASGQTIPWADMRRYLEDRIAGQPVTPPTAKKPPG
ncbi:ribbon-helix-helix protein, CopG family [Rugamonas apoptosis]|uniref:Ribbon-helix-helix protein, CopG family n=1 Tax=Rugamonas apoptosis TaxID=2758570 RepID=A0A7W2FDP1_9BURK|nr:ribbon-helix-helix protein, CopG family [Rugamonas apoptosis]MBA5689712.1 ribbon-helix-helix protein, CopG family [Rugamonas apoptosis]